MEEVAGRHMSIGHGIFLDEDMDKCIERSLALRASSHEKLQKWYLDAVNCRQDKDRAFAKACALALPEKYEKEISHE